MTRRDPLTTSALSRSTDSDESLLAMRCVDASAGRSMIGTADRVDLWLFIEVAGRWSAQVPDALAAQAPLDSACKRLTEAAAGQGLKLRSQLIKQTGRRGERRVLVALGNLAFSLSGGTAALIAVDAGTLVDNLLAARSRPAENLDGFERLSEPQYFVCTHGQRDRCCGALGLPIYRALNERLPGRVWQTSHVGGHRFAPNVLTLPRAVLYGRLELQSLDAFIDAVETDQIAFPWLRGRSVYPPVVQAAEALLARQELRLLHVDGDDQAARVTFADHRHRYRIDVQRSGVPERILASCGAPQLKDYAPFAALSKPLVSSASTGTT
ncbi:MAG: sucrase ferredoxin [Pseudomonadota bacterium]